MSSADEALLTLELPEARAAAGAARKALGSLNGSLHLISSSRLVDSQLLITELVANAITHGAPSPGVTVQVRARPEALRVEVTDAGEGFDPTRLAVPSRSGGGWGLHFVAMLADRWGVDAGGPTTVWFEIDTPRREEPARPRLVDAE